METAPRTVSTLVLGGSTAPVKAVARDASNLRVFGPGEDVPSDGRDDGRAEERIDQLVRDLLEACQLGDASRFQAAGFVPAASSDVSESGERSGFTAAGFAAGARGDVSDCEEDSRFEAAGFAPASSADEVPETSNPDRTRELVDRIVRELVDACCQGGTYWFEDLQAPIPASPNPSSG